MAHYDPKEIERKWQKKWLDEKVFAAHDNSAKPKYYQLETFPYPSAAGLHVGHPKGYIAEDIHARYMRMGGKDAAPREVLYTMGWDAFGLPTENYAIKVGRSPQEVARENTENFRRQVRAFGFSYDWDREIDTSSPEYYKWTQWLFIELFKKGLAYRAAAKVNWCPNDQTVVANEQVLDGKCERCGAVIEERDMEQWFLKITDYAERLLTDLKGLDWPAATVKRQEDWIGKSEGALIKFPLTVAGQNSESTSVEVFTTRPDTLFGATYLVLAPEHSVIQSLKTQIENWDEVSKYIEAATHKTELMRKEDEKEKTGVELKGAHAMNPATGEQIPVWVADYVLGSYGTGAIMAVPAHDGRDAEFAKKFGLKTVRVVDGNAVDAPGTLVGSGKFTGMDSEKAKWEITASVGGVRKTQFRIRDWSVSRQRYWGVPIPMIHCDVCRAQGRNGGIVPVPENELPVLLPELKEYRPKGMPPLAGAPDFMKVKCPQCGADATRDPETLDTFVDSSWYYLRYADPKNVAAIFDKAKAAHWLPADLYVIGAEHTVLHLLYSRFITKFLHDKGYILFNEPFLKLRHQGMIRGADGQKMSKSKGNVVNPDGLIAEFGADTVRVYEMFMGAFEEGAPWDPKGILGAERFLKRAWSYVSAAMERATNKKEESVPTQEKNPAVQILLQKTTKKVGEDIEAFKFNTAISALMILLNELEKNAAEKSAMLAPEDLAAFVKLLHPFAPHMAQELWSRVPTGTDGKPHETYLDFEPWPQYDAALLAEEKITLVLQVDGRVRDTVSADATINEEAAKALALANEKVKAALGAQTPKKIIYVDKKLVNIVLS